MNTTEFKHSLNDFSNCLNALNGSFSPDSMSAQLFFGDEELPDKIHIYFHERFHYLQTIFTSYGHIKWGINRSMTSDVIDDWLHLYKTNGKGILSAYYYLNNNKESNLQPLADIFLKNYARIMSNLSATHYLPDVYASHFDDVSKQLPKIEFNGNSIDLTDKFIFESFAKFEEALFRLAVNHTPIVETINPDTLNPEYYLLIQYFVSKIGPSRMLEFPAICEIALNIQHIPRPDNIKDNHPGSRFLKIIDFLQNNPDIVLSSLTDDDAFLTYTNSIYTGCGFAPWDEIWKESIEYASMTDLTLSKEMLKAINFKINNPRALSYALFDNDIFNSEEFMSFHPLFIITNDGIIYNLANISIPEFAFECHFQALAYQIIGIHSKRCIYPDMLQCGYSYYGINECKYYKEGLCDGHVDCKSKLLDLEISNGQLINGCGFEFFLRVLGCSVKDIEVINTGKQIIFDDIKEAIHRINKQDN